LKGYRCREQGAIIGKMAQKIPQERFPERDRVALPLLGNNDRENMNKDLASGFAQPVFCHSNQSDTRGDR